MQNERSTERSEKERKTDRMRKTDRVRNVHRQSDKTLNNLFTSN